MPEVLAALIYDAVHQARVWSKAPRKTIDAYMTALEAVYVSEGLTMPGDPETAASGDPGGE
jgi:hypothetical protein